MKALRSSIFSTGYGVHYSGLHLALKEEEEWRDGEEGKDRADGE